MTYRKDWCWLLQVPSFTKTDEWSCNSFCVNTHHEADEWLTLRPLGVVHSPSRTTPNDPLPSFPQSISCFWLMRQVSDCSPEWREEESGDFTESSVILLAVPDKICKTANVKLQHTFYLQHLTDTINLVYNVCVCVHACVVISSLLTCNIVPMMKLWILQKKLQIL